MKTLELNIHRTPIKTPMMESAVILFEMDSIKLFSKRILSKKRFKFFLWFVETLKSRGLDYVDTNK